MKPFNQRGFTLVEIMVVMAIIGLVLVGSLSSNKEVRKVNKQNGSELVLKNLKNQLLQFGMVNKYLPCPDSSGDGQENRTAVGGFNGCSATYGTVPFITLGIARENSLDGWGSLIRYAVNTETNTASICDPSSSASYFCNRSPGTAVFNLQQTPPVMTTTAAGGNYIVCNENVSACSSATTDSNLSSKWPSVVLVALNEDATETLASCGSKSGATQENCDNDSYFHAAQNTSGTSSATFFDDSIEIITGYEIKAKLLSPVISWTDFIPPENQPPATYEGYDLAAGNYTPRDDVTNTNEENQDALYVNRNITTALNLGLGDDYVIVGNDLSSSLEYDNITGTITDIGTQAALDTGEGDDTVYIVGRANSNVSMGDGNDTFVLGTDLMQAMNAGGGNDKVWVQGNVNYGSNLDLGAGDDVLWLGNPEETGVGELSQTIYGGSGFDILVLENFVEWDDLSLSEKSRVNGFELVYFSDHASTNPTYHEP